MLHLPQTRSFIEPGRHCRISARVSSRSRSTSIKLGFVRIETTSFEAILSTKSMKPMIPLCQQSPRTKSADASPRLPGGYISLVFRRYSVRSNQHLLASSAMKYQFMAEYRQEYPITTMCRVLSVSVSGYYAWCKRAPSQHSREDALLAEEVKRAFKNNRCVYGSPRVHAELRAQGLHCARKRAARLMRQQGLFAKLPHHRTITTQSEPGAQVAPDLLQRDFSADQPNSKWVGDTTYIWTLDRLALSCSCA